LLDSETTTGLERKEITVEEAGIVLNALIGRDDCCTGEEAAISAQHLIGLYPAREVNDPKVYASGVTALLAAYPLEFVRRVCNPVTGLPSRLKWLPTLAEIREALDAEQTRRGRIGANAKYILEMARRAEENAEFERNRLPAEERKRRVQELLKPFRTERSASEYPPSQQKEQAA
jgi:predicted DNA-binding WGR domain protein